MEIITSMFEVITNVITNFTSSLSSAITSITSIFYTSGENGGFTLVGTLLLVAVGVGLVYWAFRLIKGLVKSGRA